MEDKDLLEYAFKKGIITKENYLLATRDPTYADVIQWQVREACKTTDMVIEQARKFREEEIKKAEEENRIARLKAASQMGVSVEVYEQIMLKQAGAKAELDVEVEKVRCLADIEINKVKVMNENAANRQVKLALLASIQEAARRYYDLRARKASRLEIDNAKRHLDDLERRWTSF